MTPLDLIDHGIAADQGSFEPATTLLPPPGFCKYFCFLQMFFVVFRFFGVFFFNFSYFLKMELSYILYSHRKIFKNPKCGNKRWDLKPVLNYYFRSRIMYFYSQNFTRKIVPNHQEIWPDDKITRDLVQF